jgi:hypothetical protein
VRDRHVPARVVQPLSGRRLREGVVDVVLAGPAGEEDRATLEGPQVQVGVSGAHDGDLRVVQPAPGGDALHLPVLAQEPGRAQVGPVPARLVELVEVPRLGVEAEPRLPTPAAQQGRSSAERGAAHGQRRGLPPPDQSARIDHPGAHRHGQSRDEPQSLRKKSLEPQR